MREAAASLSSIAETLGLLGDINVVSAEPIWGFSFDVATLCYPSLQSATYGKVALQRGKRNHYENDCVDPGLLLRSEETGNVVGRTDDYD